MSPAARPPVGYAEVAEFHVAIARREDPSLLERPVVVGGDPDKRGKVVAASASLRERGIVDGMGVAEALDRAPEARWVRTDMGRAREVSGSLRAAVRREVEAVELEGLAGFYVRAPVDPADGESWAGQLIESVMRQTGLPLRVGVAPARFAARLAAEDAGGDGARILDVEGFEAYLLALPLARLPGVGPKTAARLADLGAVDVPSLRSLGLERLESALRRDGLSAGRIALRLAGPGERTLTRSCSLEAPVADASALARAAQGLMDRVDLGGHDFRRVGIVLKGLEAVGAEDRQLDLF